MVLVDQADVGLVMVLADQADVGLVVERREQRPRLQPRGGRRQARGGLRQVLTQQIVCKQEAHNDNECLAKRP